jgi:hypothetical protein
MTEAKRATAVRTLAQAVRSPHFDRDVAVLSLVGPLALLPSAIGAFGTAQALAATLCWIAVVVPIPVAGGIVSARRAARRARDMRSAFADPRN